MTVRIVRLGTEKVAGEGIRIGTVRHPPRGVEKSRYSVDNWFDVWLPNLAPSTELLKTGRQSQSEREWKIFARRYRTEMGESEKSRVLDLLAALSHTTNFSVGCYCADEERCHRSVLRELLLKRKAELA